MFNLPKYGDGICLARVDALLDALSIDRARLQRRSVVVTGSNGKGSTAALCAGIARAYGLRTGAFTSPHLYRFNERFQIDGVAIDDDTLADLVARVATAIADLTRHGLNESFGVNESFGAFEAQFALACLYFQEAGCAFTVFEAGIGGRYDPVRMVGSRLTCVTSLDYEHVALLGDTLELICSDKSDACAAGGTIVYGENCLPLAGHIAAYNINRDIASLHVRREIAIEDLSDAGAARRFGVRFGGHRFAALKTQLPGDFQINNSAIALALFLLWLKQEHRDATPVAIDAAVRAGLRDTRWPGRLERVQSDPLTVIDVGHTPDAVAQALTGLRATYGSDGWMLVLGVSGDKSIDAIVTRLAPFFDTIICTAAYHKGADAHLIEAAVRRANPDADIRVASSIEGAVKLSQQLARQRRRKVYVAGGLFVAIEYATVLSGGRAQDLQFF